MCSFESGGSSGWGRGIVTAAQASPPAMTDTPSMKHILESPGSEPSRARSVSLRTMLSLYSHFSCPHK